jgi:hypothetical protein
VATLSKRE